MALPNPLAARPQVVGGPMHNTQMENSAFGQAPQLDNAPFSMGGGQTYTMMASRDNGQTGGYDGGGINPGGGTYNAPPPSAPTPPPAAGVPVTTPAGPSTPVAPPSLGPTADSPLAPLNDYQARQGQSSYQSPTFQGGNSYQAGSYTAP